MLAAGAYSGVAALYDAATLAPMALLPDGHSAGITQASDSAKSFSTNRFQRMPDVGELERVVFVVPLLLAQQQ